MLGLINGGRERTETGIASLRGKRAVRGLNTGAGARNGSAVRSGVRRLKRKQNAHRNEVMYEQAMLAFIENGLITAKTM